MIVGVPREVKSDEYRVALLPVGAEELRRAGHRVLVQSGAGVRGVAPANGVGPGGGVVVSRGARGAAGFAANIVILAVDLERLRYLDAVMPPNVTPLFSDRHASVDSISRADLVIGAVLI